MFLLSPHVSGESGLNVATMKVADGCYGDVNSAIRAQNGGGGGGGVVKGDRVLVLPLMFSQIVLQDTVMASRRVDQPPQLRQKRSQVARCASTCSFNPPSVQQRRTSPCPKLAPELASGAFRAECETTRER